MKKYEILLDDITINGASLREGFIKEDQNRMLMDCECLIAISKYINSKIEIAREFDLEHEFDDFFCQKTGYSYYSKHGWLDLEDLARSVCLFMALEEYRLIKILSLIKDIEIKMRGWLVELEKELAE